MSNYHVSPICSLFVMYLFLKKIECIVIWFLEEARQLILCWYIYVERRGANHGPFSLVQLCRWKSCGHFPPVELYSGSFCDFGKTMAFGELFRCKKSFFYTFTVRGECLCNHFSPPQVSLQLKTSSLLCNYPHTNPNTCRLHRSYALGKLTALKQQMCGATSHDDMPWVGAMICHELVLWKKMIHPKVLKAA